MHIATSCHHAYTMQLDGVPVSTTPHSYYNAAGWSPCPHHTTLLLQCSWMESLSPPHHTLITMQLDGVPVPTTPHSYYNATGWSPCPHHTTLLITKQSQLYLSSNIHTNIHTNRTCICDFSVAFHVSSRSRILGMVPARLHNNYTESLHFSTIGLISLNMIRNKCCFC